MGGKNTIIKTKKVREQICFILARQKNWYDIYICTYIYIYYISGKQNDSEKLE